jgi:hypothetical protein
MPGGWRLNRSEVGVIRSTDRTNPVSREISREGAGPDMGGRISPFRIVFEYITDITAIYGHEGIPSRSFPH